MGLATAPATVAGAAGPATTIYDSTTGSTPSSYIYSVGFDATQTSAIGNEISFGAGSRTLNNVAVTMVSWACQTGAWYNADCASAAGSTYDVPLTLTLYAAGPGDTVGASIYTTTQTLAIPYRPSVDNTHCAAFPDPAGGAVGGDFWDGTYCEAGLAANVTFTVPDITVPGTLIYGVSYATTSSGATPYTVGGNPCTSTEAGCFYDALNVGLSSDPDNMSTGTNTVANSIFQQSASGGSYCDGGTGGTGTFRLDSGCWQAQNPNSQPEVPASNPTGMGPVSLTAPVEGLVPAVQFNTTCSTTCYVNASTGNDANDGTSGSPVATITKALSLVSSGGTVYVAAGTYDENVVITKPLTLDGANAGVSAAGPATRSAESVITAPYITGNLTSVEIASPHVTVDGFSVVQSVPVTCLSCADFGIEVDPTSPNATVQNDIVSGVSTSASSGNATGNPIGIFVAGNGSAQPNAVSVNHDAVSGVTSSGTERVSAQGILVGDSSNHGSATGLSLQSNRISGVSSSGRGAYGILLNRGNTSPIVQGNTVSGITAGTGGWAHGISLDAPQASPTIVNNAISGVVGPNPTGGNVADIFVDAGDTSAGTGLLAGNSLTDTSAGGLVNGAAGTVPAAGNWWGCTGGANTAGCAPTGGPITLTPWIVSSTPDGTKVGQPGFWPTAIATSVAPSFTSGANASFNLNQPSSFTVSANGLPASVLTESGTLPPGVSFNPVTGSLVGTPTAVGTFPISFTAHNGAYTDATQAFTLTVTSNTSTITSASSVQIAAGKKVNFTVTTGGHPAASVTESGLPGWLTLTPGTGSKAGTAKLTGVGPVVGGDYTFVIHASNGIGPDTLQSFTVHVLAISSLASASFTKSGPVTQSFTVTTTGVGAGVSLSATLGGNLAGLTFHDNGNGTATISGQPGPTDRTHLVKVIAQAGAALTTQKLAIGISN
jgi:hypothetical protein